MATLWGTSGASRSDVACPALFQKGVTVVYWKRTWSDIWRLYVQLDAIGKPQEMCNVIAVPRGYVVKQCKVRYMVLTSSGRDLGRYPSLRSAKRAAVAAIRNNLQDAIGNIDKTAMGGVPTRR